MEFKSLFLGMFFSLGIFAIKSGIGLSYFFAKKKSLKIKTAVLTIYSGVYLILFLLSYFVLKKIDFLQYFEQARAFFKSGMFIHIIAAGLLAAWGIALLKRNNKNNKSTYGWLALVIPCPVCMTVILFTVAFLISYFPASGITPLMGGYAAFIIISFLMLPVLHLVRASSGAEPEAILGAAMLGISIYFFLSVIILPQFSDMDKIYRLALYQGESQNIPLKYSFLSVAATLTSFFTGFLITTQNIRKI